MSSQKYTPELKREVANLVPEHNDTHREATEAMSQTSLRRWLQQPGKEKRGETLLKGKAITAEQYRPYPIIGEIFYLLPLTTIMMKLKKMR